MSTAVDDETILELLRSNSAPQMTTTEVAGHLPVTRGTTRTRLQRLADDGLLDRETDGNDVVWWLPEREAERETWEPDGDEESREADGTEPESDETEIAVTATEQAEESAGETEVEVEAVETEPSAETPDEETETRTATEREPAATLSDDDEGLRVLAGVAVGLVALILLRRLLGDGE
ncbi:hypothetical protein BRD20_08675 [Halobacteriales archaeon SW_8_65_20]|nr:MAG: hypothetical protein BRD20_08675 [Halobacteriales archaeon SW_8_65_20]